MARHAALRASDADRDAVAERLRAAAVEGRLDADELEQRVHIALRARTYGQLEQLLEDLPGACGAWRRGRGVAARSTTTTAFVLAVRLLAFLVVATVAIALIMLAATWWFFWVLVWFVVCGRHRHHRLAPPRRAWHGRSRPASSYIWT